MILTPSAYKQSKGIGVARVSEDSCCWKPSAVGAILDNSAYVGATEGLKSLRVSFKSKKRVPAPKEHRVVVEDTHEPIIDRLVWEKVQTLRQNKRRPTKTGATSIFSGLLCCADCGSKMNLCVSNGYHFFRCGGYKRNSRTKECTIHYIRESVLEQLVLKQLQHFLSYMCQFERAFVKRLIDSSIADKEYELYQKQKQLEKCEKRAKEIDRYFRKTYEDNVSGKLSDEMYMELSHKYEVERLELKTKIFEYKERLAKISEMEQNKDDFLKAVRKFMEMKSLTAPMLRELIDHIDVYEKEGGKKNYTQRIVIYYRFVGYLELPSSDDENYKANTRKGVDVEYIPTVKSA